MLKWIGKIMGKYILFLWELIKLGGTPLIIVTIFWLTICWGWDLGVHHSHNFVDNKILNVGLNLAMVSVASAVFGFIRKQLWFQNLIINFLKVPIAGPLVYRLLAVGPLTLVEVKTVWGPTPEECAWEYAILLGSWDDNIFGRTLTWFRVHTLGFGSGKLLERTGKAIIIFIPNEEQKNAWIVVIIMGFIDLRDKNKSA